MKKSRLVSLLAIPVFSLATTFNSFSATPFNSYQESKKIKTTTVAGSVLDFLLGSPKISKKMSSDQKLALGIISDLLKLQGQREHEIDYATAGKNLIINTTDGRQAQFVKDANDNLCLVMDGKVYRISQEVINQASNLSVRNIPTIGDAILPQYNLRGLESRFNSNPKEDISQYYRVQKEGEYLSDIAKKFEVSPSNIFYWVNTKTWEFQKSKYELRSISKQKKIWENKKKIKRSLSFSSHKDLLLVKEKHKNQISAVFSYKWHRDLNNDGALDFDEFNQVRRTFYDDEYFNIGVKYQTEKGFKGNLKIKILEDNTGKLLINEKTEILSNGLMVGQQYIPAGSLPEGIYLLYANLINNDLGSVSSKSEKVEIVQRK